MIKRTIKIITRLLSIIIPLLFLLFSIKEYNLSQIIGAQLGGWGGLGEELYAFFLFGCFLLSCILPMLAFKKKLYVDPAPKQTEQIANNNIIGIKGLPITVITLTCIGIFILSLPLWVFISFTDSNELMTTIWFIFILMIIMFLALKMLAKMYKK